MRYTETGPRHRGSVVAGVNGDNFFMSADTDLGSYVTSPPNVQNLLG